MPYGEPIIGQRYIICEECQKKFKKLTHCHLFKIHGLTITEYKRKWGFCATQPLEALYIKKIRQDYAKIYELEKKGDTKPYRFKKGRVVEREISEQERLRLASIAVNIQHTKKFRDIQSKSSKKVWKRKGYRDKYIKNYKIKLKVDSPDFKERMSKQSKKFWDNPDNKKQESIKRKKLWNTPAKKKYASERSLKYWSKIKSI